MSLNKLLGTNLLSVAAGTDGGEYSAFVGAIQDLDGTVWTMGQNNYGELGNGSGGTYTDSWNNMSVGGSQQRLVLR